MKLSEYLNQLRACKEAIEWVGSKTIEQSVAECHRGDWLLWMAYRASIDQRKIFLAKGLCANTVRHLMQDQRSINAVDAAIAYGKGEINKVELENAASAAHGASVAVYYYAAYAAYAAAAYHYTIAHNAASAAADAADATYAADDAKKENQAKTADICREVFGEELINKVNEALWQHE